MIVDLTDKLGFSQVDIDAKLRQMALMELEEDVLREHVVNAMKDFMNQHGREPRHIIIGSDFGKKFS